jgi:hypothetical protein
LCDGENELCCLSASPRASGDTRQQWAIAILNQLGYSTSQNNVIAMLGWCVNRGCAWRAIGTFHISR